MKLLVFSDVHTQEIVIAELEKKRKQADLLVNTGDFSWFGAGTQEMIDLFESWSQPMLLIHGNHEYQKDVENYVKDKKHIQFVHKKTIMMDDIMFVCHGGEWINRISEDFEKWSVEIDKEIKKHKPKKLVLVIHQPPYGTKQDYIFEMHRGNESYRKWIEHYKPELVVFGHFHETFHIKDKIGKSLLVNVGPDGELFDL